MMGIEHVGKWGLALKVEVVANGNLRVWLSEAQLKLWGLWPPEQAQSMAHLRGLVRRVLHMTGVQPPSRLLAEMFPVEGGCLLLLSPYGRADRGMAVGPVVYRLADTDAVFDLLERWYLLPISNDEPGMVLYEQQQAYDLAVCPLVPLSEEQLRLLDEYGQPVGVGAAALAAADEHGRLLGSGEALRRLGFTEPAPLAPAGPDQQT